MVAFEVVSLVSEPESPSKKDEDVKLTAKVKRTDSDEGDVTVRLVWRLNGEEVTDAPVTEEPAAADKVFDLTHSIKLTDDTAGTYSIGASVNGEEQELGGENSLEIPKPSTGAIAFEVVSLVSEPESPSKKDEDVTLTAKVKRTDTEDGDVTVRLAWRLNGEEVTDAPVTEEPAAADKVFDLTHSIKLTDDTAGTYSIGASVNGEEQELGDKNSLKIAKPSSGDTGEPEAAVDPRDLVWDPNFALSTGAITAAIAIFFSVVYGVWAFSSDYDRLEHFFVVTAAWVGGLVILGATWLVVLEMRGRAPKTVGQAEQLPSKGLVTDMLDKVNLPEIGKTLRSMRGVVAVLFIGFGLFVLAWVTVERVDEPSEGSATNSSSTP